MSEILITGAGGFVGNHLIGCLGSDYSIIGLDRQPPKEKAENIRFHAVDITEPQEVQEIISGHRPKVIFHMAAIAQSWVKDETLLHRVNFLGTKNILEAVLGVADYHPKIIYISSAEVYGKTSHPENITEEEDLNPVNPYAVSKKDADRLVYNYSQTHSLYTVILRPFNHTGPGQAEGFFVPDMAAQIARLERSDDNTLLVGNLDSVRDLSDVRDVVRAYRLAIETDFTPGEAYNICSGIGHKMKDYLDMLLSKAHKKIDVKQDPTRLRPSDIPVFIGNHQKFSLKTGWEPEIPLEKTIEDVLNYYRHR